MNKKVIQVGTSAAVTLPKKELKEIGLAVGDDVQVVLNEKTRSFTIKPVALPVQVNEELYNWTKKFISKNRSILKNLADK